MQFSPLQPQKRHVERIVVDKVGVVVRWWDGGPGLKRTELAETKHGAVGTSVRADERICGKKKGTF